MPSAVLAGPAPCQFNRVASPIHTVIVLAVEAVLAYSAHLRTAQMHAVDHAGRLRMYERTILVEWLVLALVIVGVRLHGSPLTAVFGERWRSLRQVFTDIGIALVFLIVSIMVLSALGGHNKGPDASTAFLFPHGRGETSMWILLSLTAGICEEGLYRGYLQRQFTAFTKSAPIGIALSAAAFGAAHAYQGWRHAAQIAALGAMLGALAYWRRTVRPGMISHAAQDILAIFVRH
jgi:membrane protease YdiL (CAAX protease family)